MGQPKAWLPFGNELLLQRVVRRLSTVAEPVVVVRAPGQTLPELPKNTLVTEDTIENRGPLQGIASGLSALRGLVDVAFVSSTDAPFVDPDLVIRLCELRRTSHDLVVPHASDRHHPLAALYALNVLPEIECMLAANQLRLMDLLRRVCTLVVNEEELNKLDPRLRFLSNVNTPEDYRAALADDVDD
jgi:molybdenum cofactor guanylyltransferase